MALSELSIKVGSDVSGFKAAMADASKAPNDQLAVGMDGLKRASRAATDEVQSFVGAIPGMGVAAERFTNLIPSLGDGIRAAFPALGAIAFAEGLSRIGETVSKLAEQFDPVIKAEKQAAEEAKKFDADIKTIAKDLETLQAKRFEDMFGKAASDE